MEAEEMRQIGRFMLEVLQSKGDESVTARVRDQVREFAASYSLTPSLAKTVS
jgi:glycine/serine hydroxymethyltransferase